MTAIDAAERAMGSRVAQANRADLRARDETIIRLRAMIAAAESDMSAMRERKPNVTDGHSDGVRVRYVKRATTIEALQAVLDMLDGVA